MNKIIEELAFRIDQALIRYEIIVLVAKGDANLIPNKSQFIAKAAIACITGGELDPKGLDKAIDVVLDVFDKEPTTSEYAESIIRAYLTTLKESV